MQAITSVAMMLLAMLGGLWFPMEFMPHWMSLITKATPTYWMAELGKGAVMAHEPVTTSVLVLAVWAAGLGVLVAMRYRRDSARV